MCTALHPAARFPRLADCSPHVLDLAADLGNESTSTAAAALKLDGLARLKSLPASCRCWCVVSRRWTVSQLLLAVAAARYFRLRRPRAVCIRAAASNGDLMADGRRITGHVRRQTVRRLTADGKR